MKVYVVRSFAWYDKYGESSFDENEKVFRRRKDAEKYISDCQSKNKKNTESEGIDYTIEEMELE